MIEIAYLMFVNPLTHVRSHPHDDVYKPLTYVQSHTHSTSIFKIVF